MMKQWPRAVAPLLLLAALAGCTNQYKPVSDWERRVSSESRRDVYPNDVRKDPAAYGNVVVAWAGTLRDAEIIDDPEHPYVILLVEHHYYDWLEDHSTQRQVYFLSPRGEGLFRCTWGFKKDWDREAMRKLITNGDMMVVYGTPQPTSGETIELGRARYVREIPQRLVATDVLDYGRPGEPSRILRTPITH